MIEKRRLLAGALTAALLTTALPGLALAQDPAEDDATYAAEGVEWVLSGYMEDDALRELASEDPVPATVTLTLEDGTASGSAGCNEYTGSYEITEDTLTFGDDIALTMMFCEGPQADVEQAYLALLPEVAGWAVDDYTLSLSDDEDTEILRYDEAIVELRGSDLAALDEALASLDEAVASLEESNSALGDTVARIDGRLAAVEESVGGVNVRGVRDRVRALEDEMGQVQQDITRLQEQQRNMGNRLGGQESRIAEVEDQVATHFEAYPVPVPSPSADPE